MSAAISGVADSPVGKLAGTTTFDLYAAIADATVSDAGVGLDRVDGLVVSPPLVGGFPRHAAAVAEYLGIAGQLTGCSTVSLGGASALSGLMDATAWVESGRCRAVLVMCADTPRTGQARSESIAAFAAMRHPEWERPFGMMNVAAYGLVASAYLARHQLEADALAGIPPVMRAHATTHPDAVYREPLTADDVVGSRMVASPLRLLECSSVADGGAGLLVTAGSGAGHPRLRAGAQRAHYDNVAYAGDLTRSGAGLSGPAALAEAGMDAVDADVAMIYDSYSVTFAMEVEELGICAPGGAPRLAADGAFGLDGMLPTNTHGGLLSHAHCGAAAGVHHLTEAVRQLRGTAANQVPGARTALVHAEGGIISQNCTAVLEI